MWPGSGAQCGAGNGDVGAAQLFAVNLGSGIALECFEIIRYDLFESQHLCHQPVLLAGWRAPSAVLCGG